MRADEDNRHPDEIADDVERTRADLGHTLEAIQSKLTPGQMMDQAFNYARTSLPADFGSNLGNAVRNNPLPVTLIGIGIAWLAATGQNPRYSTARRDAEYESDFASAYGADMAADEEGTSEGRMHKAASKVTDAGHRISGKASQLRHRISETASSLSGRAREASSRMHDSAGNTRARMSERMGDIGHRSQERYHRTRDTFSTMVEEQPLMSGVLGMAIGAALGAAFPATRREDELMGRTRDDLMERARETGREQAENLRESVRHVTETTKQEARRFESESGMHGQGDGHAADPSTSASSSIGGVPGEGGRPSLH